MVRSCEPTRWSIEGCYDPSLITDVFMNLSVIITQFILNVDMHAQGCIRMFALPPPPPPPSRCWQGVMSAASLCRWSHRAGLRLWHRVLAALRGSHSSNRFNNGCRRAAFRSTSLQKNAAAGRLCFSAAFTCYIRGWGLLHPAGVFTEQAGASCQTVLSLCCWDAVAASRSDGRRLALEFLIKEYKTCTSS